MRCNWTNFLLVRAPPRDRYVHGFSKRTEPTMGRSLTVTAALERVATRRSPNSGRRPKSQQQVRFYDVTVTHANPKAIAEQNHHLTTSMSPCAQSASITMSSVRMQRPFPTPPDILRHMVLRSCHRLLPLRWKLGPNKDR